MTPFQISSDPNPASLLNQSINQTSSEFLLQPTKEEEYIWILNACLYMSDRSG